MKKYKVFVGPSQDYATTLRSGLDWLQISETLAKAQGIFLKPNLTFPCFRPGVTTTKEMLAAAMDVFSDINPRVVLGESDGGYGSFDIEQAFESFDLFNLGEKYHVEVVNLSRQPTLPCHIPIRSGRISLNLPRFLIEEDFITVTLPVPKVHCMTGISLSYKNQWGCIPDMMRLRLHPYFDELIGPLNRELKLGLSIMDGTYGLTKNGPIIEGEVVTPGWVVMSNNPGAADCLTCHLMGLKLHAYSHYRHIHQETPLPRLEEIETNEDIGPYLAQTPQFYLKRNIWNFLAKTAWYSRHWNYLMYESKLAPVLRKIMYKFREKPKVCRKYRPSG